jgi:hypothetical protein
VKPLKSQQPQSFLPQDPANPQTNPQRVNFPAAGMILLVKSDITMFFSHGVRFVRVPKSYKKWPLVRYGCNFL